MTIVGIVQNVRYDGLTGKVQPAIYLPFDQVPRKELDILLRTTVEPGSLASAMRKAVVDVDPYQPLFDVQTMDGAYRDRLVNHGCSLCRLRPHRGSPHFR
jgi:hypothetical protein